MKYLGLPFEHHRICEWAINSIKAYKNLHFPNDHTDYSADFTDEQIAIELHHLVEWKGKIKELQNEIMEEKDER